ncbi:MAG: radical SAM protein [Phycisphaerales bacterium]|jgi:aminodeoxyfutalosine synthase|nr:radical SAM protein [Phycisphaerales bacterium]
MTAPATKNASIVSSGSGGSRAALGDVGDGLGHGQAHAVGPDPRLEPIRDKVLRGQRLSLQDGEVLYGTPDIYGVCALADVVRRRLHGDVAYYNINRHLNYSNVCALSCKFCEFYRKDGQEGAYTRDMEYVRQQVRLAVEGGATEMHSVGGLHPKLPFSYYTDLMATIHDEARKQGSDLHVKAFTAVEVVHLAKIARKYDVRDRRAGIRWVLQELQAAGLGSLPGGGAEVFDDRIHDEAYKGKIRSDVWLDVHYVAHELGLNSNATILYGHIEQRRDRLVHMDMLRRAQDVALARLGYVGEATGTEATERRSDGATKGEEGRDADGGFGADGIGRHDAFGDGGHLGYTGAEGAGAPVITLTKPGVLKPLDFIAARQQAGGSVAGQPVPKAGYFQTIIPLPFFPDGSELEHLPGPSGLENLRTLAVARLMLDNFPHAKAFWIMQTLPMAQLMLQNGADDIDGTIVWYDITKVNHGAGQGSTSDNVATHQEVNTWTLTKAIREAGFRPVERDTLYRPVIREGRGWRV